MSDIFREVDEEVRRSRAEAMWRKYSGLLFAVCVLIVLAVAGWRFFEWRRETAAAAAGARFEEALQLLQTGKTAEGEAAMAKIAGEETGIYRTLAQLRAGSDLARRDKGAAIKAFDAIAADAAVEPGLRDVARLRAAAVAVDVEGFAEVERRMGPLLTASSTWRHAARELLAASALKVNDLGKARQLLDSIIIDNEAPAAVKARAELLIGLTRGAK